jgi:glycosyltransferase involved in cell wall biosynthesis
MLEPRILIVPTHPGVQYHFCRSGLPIWFLGHWDQFHYWRPQPANVRNVLPRFEDAQLDHGPEDFARLLDDGASVGWPERYDVAWLMFNWQWKLFRNRPGKKLYRVCKHAELERHEWEDLFSRDGWSVVSFYPNTVRWLREQMNVEVPYVPLGLDPAAYGPWEGLASPKDEQVVLSIIHSYRERGWHHRSYLEAMGGVPHRHVDHLDDTQEKVSYEGLQRLLRRSRVYLHDGEQEYTITLIEALMTGLPIVSFRIPGIERYVVHGVNGFVGDDAKSIREHCRLLLADDALAERMGRESRAMALRDYHEERWRGDWQRILRDFAST